MERENELRRMKQKEEQNEREIAELRDKLSRAASLMTPQVNKMIKERDQRIELLSPTRSLQVN